MVLRYPHPDGLPGYIIDAPWPYVLGAPLWAEELSREAWLDEVCERLGLRRVRESEPS
jgi:hypothetical protein